MTHDDEFESVPPPVRARSGGRLVVAGVVGACALGIGLGLWARPAPHEGPLGPAPKAEPKEAPLPVRGLEIVIDDTPPPIGSPLDVLPAGIAVAVPVAPKPAPAMPMAPKPAPNGLVKVDAPMVVEAPPVVKPVIKAVEVTPAKSPTAPVKKAKVEAKPKPEAETKVARKAPKDTPKLAKAEKPARKAEKVKLAKAEPKKKPAKAEEKKPSRLVRLARAVKATPAKVEKKLAKAEPPKESRKAKLARVKAEKRKTELAKAEARKLKLAKAEAKKPKKIEPRGTGPMRVAKANRCASPDPGAALVCADPRLASRDRQMQVAYRNAEAAGVPASSLRRQQQRWESARTAAAREAPWAVEDVYQARIAELNDLARDANGAY